MSSHACWTQWKRPPSLYFQISRQSNLTHFGWPHGHVEYKSAFCAMLIATTETATVPVYTSDHRKILVRSLPFIRPDQQSIRRPQTVYSDFRYQDTASQSTIAALSPVNKVLSHPSLTPSQWLAVAYCSARIAFLPSQNASEESSHWHHLQIKSVC